MFSSRKENGRSMNFRKNTLNQLPILKGPPPNRQIKITIKSNDKDLDYFFGQDEFDHLAKEIGYDQDLDKAKYWWFLKQILLTDLPTGWEREQDIDGYTQFNNIEENYQSREHPLRHYFRKLFQRMLKMEKELNRPRELSLQKRSIAKKKAVYGSLSMEFYQRNLTKTKKGDKNGTELLYEDILNVNNQRSKAKLNSMIQNVKEQRRVAPNGFIKFEEQTPGVQIEIIKDIEKESLIYYDSNFGDFIKTKEVLDSFIFKQMNMNQVLTLAQLYKIDILNESYLLWLPQYLMCLPLPSSWQGHTDPLTNQTSYLNCSKQLETQFHPIEPFAYSMIQRGRQYYKENPQLLSEIKNKLRTFDNVLRNYTLNINQVRLFFEQQEKKRRKELKNRQTALDLMNLAEINGLNQLENNYPSVNSDVTADLKISYYDNQDVPEAQYEEEKQNMSVKQSLKIKKFQKCNQRDIEIFVVANQCTIDLNKDIHMLYLISELMDSIRRQSDEAWQFRYINDQKYYWQTKDKKLKTKTFPFLSHILEKIQILQSQTENLRGEEINNYLKQNYVNFKEVQGIRGSQTLDKIKDDREGLTMDILMHFMKNKENKLNLEELREQIDGDDINYDNISYDLKSLSQHLSNKMTKEQLLDVIYFCPFNIEREKMNVIQDDLSSIQIPINQDTSSDSEFSTPNSFGGLVKKKIDPRELLLRNRKQSQFQIQQPSINDPRKLFKNSNTLDSDQSGIEIKKQSSEVNKALSILNQRKGTVLGFGEGFEEEFLSNNQRSLSNNENGRLSNIGSDAEIKEKDDSNKNENQVQEDAQNFTDQAQKASAQLKSKVEMFFQKKKNTLNQENDLKNNKQRLDKDQVDDKLKTLSQLKPSQLNQKDLDNQKEDIYKELNFKSVGVVKRKRPALNNKQTIIPNKDNQQQLAGSNSGKPGQVGSSGISHHTNIMQKLRGLQAHNQLNQAHMSAKIQADFQDLKTKLLSNNQQQQKPVNRLKKLLKRNYVKAEKFQRMLKVSQDQDIAKQFKRLLIKFQLVKMLKQDPNNQEIPKNMTALFDQRRKSSKRVSVVLNIGDVQVQNQPKGLVSLLGIIDKNKFHIEKPVKQKDNGDDSMSIFDEENKLKPFDYNDIADDNFEDLNITIEFYNVLDNYRKLAQGKREERKKAVEPPSATSKRGDTSHHSSSTTAAQPFVRRGTIVDIAGLMFLKNLAKKRNQAQKKLKQGEEIKENKSDMSFQSGKGSTKYIDKIKDRLMNVAQNIQNQVVSNSLLQENSLTQQQMDSEHSQSTQAKHAEKNNFSYFSFKNGITNKFNENGDVILKPSKFKKSRKKLKIFDGSRSSSSEDNKSKSKGKNSRIFSSHSSDYLSLKTSELSDSFSDDSDESGQSREKEQRRLKKLKNLKHVGDKKLQNLDEYFKHGNNRISVGGEIGDLNSRMKDANFRLKRQGDFETGQDFDENVAEGMISPNKKGASRKIIEGNKFPSNASLGSSSKLDESNLQTSSLENQSVANTQKGKVKDEDNDDEKEVYSKRISEFFRETIQSNPDMLKEFGQGQLKQRLTLAMDKLADGTNQNVIQEVHEDESSIDFDQFKILQQYQDMQNKKAQQDEENIQKQKQGEEKFLKSILKFKFQQPDNRNLHKQQKSLDSLSKPSTLIKTHRKVNSMSNFQGFFQTQRDQQAKFNIHEHEQKDNSPIIEKNKVFESFSPFRRKINIDTDQKNIIDFIQQKKHNFLYYSEIFGNPQSHPSVLNFSDNFLDIKPIHVIKMGQALGLLKKDQRKETYLLWIAQQLLIMPLINQENLQLSSTENQYEDKISQIKNRNHPAFDYVKCLINFQRKIFHENFIKQMHPDLYKRDCSWLAFYEEAFDYQGFQIGKRIYYYNFHTFQKSIVKPEELNYKQSVNYIYESQETQRKSTKNKGFMTDRVKNNQNHLMLASETEKLEQKFDNALLKSIKQILIKRKNEMLVIEKSPKKSLAIQLQDQQDQSSTLKLSNRSPRSKISTRFTNKSRLFLSSDRRASITQGKPNPQQLNPSETLPSLLLRSTMDRSNAKTAIGSVIGTKLHSRQISRDAQSVSSAGFTANFLNRETFAKISQNNEKQGDEQSNDNKSLNKQVKGQLMIHNLKAIKQRQ